MKRPLFFLAFLSLLMMFAPAARADVATVTKYLDEATELFDKGSQFFNDANGKLELAEASLDDVPDAQKKPLQAKIDALKGKMQAATGAADKERIDRDVKSLIARLEGLVGNIVAWPGPAEEVTTLLNDPKTAAALGAPAVAAYKKQFATMLKVHQGKAFKENYAVAKTAVDQLDKDWAERKAKLGAADTTEQDRNSAVGDTEHDLEQIERFFQPLPADNADVKALRARVDKVKAGNTAAAGAAGAATQVERINRFLDLYKSELEGMETEGAGPTWAEFKAGKGTSHEFNSPKTVNYVHRVSGFLEDLAKEEGYNAAKNDPKVKALVDSMAAKVAAGRAKFAKSASSLVDELEKEKVNDNNVAEALQVGYSIKNVLGDESPEGKPLIERLDKLQKDRVAAGNQAETDRQTYYKTMTAAADKAWPGMLSKFDVVEGFDPNNVGATKGKLVKIVGQNRMGWSFKTGDFPYAIKINGVPVAGRYDPAVKDALAEVEAKLGRAIGDSDDDGEWTAIARVEGTTGKLVQLVERSGDVKVDGSRVGTVSSTDQVPVDAPIVTIVALKAGPVAVAQGQGVAKADGSIGAPAASAGVSAGGRGIFGRLISILSGLVALLVGVACLMKAKFAPLAANAGAMQLSEKVGGQNIAYLGLAAIGLGALGVLMNLIALPSAFFAALIGLLASLAMIVAGGVAGRDFLEPRGMLPAKVRPMLTQYAIPAGIACAALGLLTLIFSIF